MKKSMIVCLLALMFTLVVFCPSCNDSYLSKTAKTLDVVNSALSGLEADVDVMVDEGLLGEYEADKIMDVVLRVNESLHAVADVLRSVEKMDDGSRAQVMAHLGEIVEALDPESLSFIAGIKNEGSRMKVNAAFAVIRAAVTGLQIALVQ